MIAGTVCASRVGSDLIKPGSQVAGVPQPIVSAEGAQIGILQAVVCVCLVPGQPPEIAVKLATILFNQAFEVGLVYSGILCNHDYPEL